MTMRRPRGFTLLEIMVALGIFGLVTVTLYGTFARTLRSKAIAERRAEVTRLGRAALGRMADEIGSAFYPKTRDGAAIFRVLKSGSETEPLDALWFTALSARPAGLDGQSTDQRVIVYFFPRDRTRLRAAAQGTGGGAPAADADERDLPANRGGRDVLADDADDFFAAFGPAHAPVLGTTPHRLLRREASIIDRRSIDDASATAFLDDVASLEFRFFDGRDWRDEWDSEDRETPRLPRAVSIDLALYDDAGEIHHFATSVDVPLSDTPIPAGSASPGASPNPKKTSAPQQESS
jgi:prepilin-type N-terminal cleavage/methylation domain-containing protein